GPAALAQGKRRSSLQERALKWCVSSRRLPLAGWRSTNSNTVRSNWSPVADPVDRNDLNFRLAIKPQGRDGRTFRHRRPDLPAVYELIDLGRLRNKFLGCWSSRRKANLQCI